MKRNIILWTLLAALIVLPLGGCAGTVPADGGEELNPLPAEDQAPEEGDVPLLDLGGSGGLPEGAAWTEPGRLEIAAAGEYRLTGALEGKVIVNAAGPVTLVFEGVSLTGERCLDIRSGDPVTLAAAAGTENVFSDTLPDPASGEASGGEPSSEEPPAGEAIAEETGEEPEENEEADTTSEEAEEDASGSVITSKAPLLFAEGSFTVNAGVNNGIRAKAGLTVQGADLTVTAAHHGLKVRGALQVLGGSVNVTAGADAITAEAGRVTAGGVELRGGAVTLTAGGRGIDAESGVVLAGGSLSITSEDDGVRADTIDVTGGAVAVDAQCDGFQALTQLTVAGGDLSVTTAGGGGAAIQHPGESFGPMGGWGNQSSALTLENSAKGLKSDGGIAVTGGVVTLNTADDSIHCATLFSMEGGEVTIVANDDAVHADDMLVISDGTLRIDDCFEGLEAFAVELRGGDVVIRAVNDGINANGQEMMFRRSSQTEETEPTSLSGSSVTYVLISGGTLDLAVTGSTSNQGDGVDSNGAVYITGGVSVVSTYGSFMENGLDTGWGGPVVTGGAVIAGGSSTMAEGFSSSSTQCCAVISTSYMPDGTEVILSDEEGNVLWDVTLADAFSCLQISHPAMEVGHVYTLTYGSQSTTLDFTNTNLIENSRGFGFRPF